MTVMDWDRLSARVDRRYRRDKLAGEVRLYGATPQGAIQASKSPENMQTPLTPVSPPDRLVSDATRASHDRAALLAEWREMCGRLANADRWFDSHTTEIDGARYWRNEELYCELMARSVELARQMASANVSQEEARA